ncbi:hypothetical protein AAHA92_05324 [Salvia divinorum]|uniref:Uncharacterized protein n=1 Tax=Salvia divinorum TaxID=28513 RepID=A0ABD1I323_SALDI
MDGKIPNDCAAGSHNARGLIQVFLNAVGGSKDVLGVSFWRGRCGERVIGDLEARLGRICVIICGYSSRVQLLVIFQVVWPKNVGLAMDVDKSMSCSLYCSVQTAK